MKHGTPVPVANGNSCASCGLRDRCKDPSKSRHYACTFFIESSRKGLDPSNAAFYDLMRELVTSESILADPYNIDDRAAPLAPNFYEWCIGEQFTNADPKPYPWQIENGLHLFGDICPGKKCSDQHWVEYIPHDCDVGEIPERLSIRQNGRCPKCGKTRLDYINAGREKDYDTLVDVVGQRCVTGDSLMLTDRGLVRIGDYDPRDGRTGWIGNDFHVKTHKHWRGKGRKAALKPVLESGSVVRADNFWVSKPEHIRIISLRGGLGVRGTNDHPIKTMCGWTTLRELRVGDYVPVSYNQNVWGRSTDVDSLDLARMLGFWVSEGSGSRGAFHVTNYDRDILDLCNREILKIKPDAEIKWRDRAGCDLALGLKRCIRTYDPVVYNYLDSLADGLWRKSADKVIPRSILEAPKVIVCAFMQALFEGDGGCGPHSVGYCSISRTLVSQLQVVLANAGIITKIRRRMTWATNGSANQISKPSWHLSIKGPSLRVFRDCIGFFSKRKRDLLDVAVNYAEGGTEQPCWFERYPDFVKSDFLQLIAEIDKEWSNIQILDGGKNPSVRASFRYTVEDWRRLESDNVSLSRIRLSRYWSKLRSLPQWRDLSRELRLRLFEFHDIYLDPNTYWTRVTSNKRSIRKHTTYDVHVPVHHRFMANGILNHNSGKCLSGDTLVQTTRGLVAIIDIVVGDYVLVHGKPHRVVGTTSTPRKFTVMITTGKGFKLQPTEKHPLMTPFGWIEAKKAKTVMVCASDVPWPEDSDAPDELLAYRKDIAQTLSRCNQWNAQRLIKRAMVPVYIGREQPEEISGHSVVLTFKAESLAIGIQQFLLTKRIIAGRVGHKLQLSHPWSLRYADSIGIDNPRVEFVARNAGEMQTNLIGKDACEALHHMFSRIDVGNDWIHPNPRELARSVQLRQSAKAGDMTYDHVAEAAVVLRGLQTKDDFAKHALISHLESVANYDCVWDSVASYKQVGKTTVYDIEVEDAHRFVANGVMAHNSVGLGLILTYHEHMLLKLKNPSAFYRIKAGTILKTTIVGLTYGGAKANVYDPMLATIHESPWFCVAEGTSITMADGSKKGIEVVKPGDEVKTLNGHALVDRVFDNGVQEVFEIEMSNGKVLRATDKHQVRCINITGNGFIWKTVSELTEDDEVVVEVDDAVS